MNKLSTHCKKRIRNQNQNPNQNPNPNQTQNMDKQSDKLIIWSHPDIISRIFKFALNHKNNEKGNFDFYVNLLCLSHMYSTIGSRVLNKSRKQFGCKCDCQKMKRYKIKDAINKWHCEGCAERIEQNSWKRSEYYEAEHKTLHKTICKECYEHHWVELLHRPLRLCIRSD